MTCFVRGGMLAPPLWASTCAVFGECNKSLQAGQAMNSRDATAPLRDNGVTKQQQEQRGQGVRKRRAQIPGPPAATSAGHTSAANQLAACQQRVLPSCKCIRVLASSAGGVVVVVPVRAHVLHAHCHHHTLRNAPLRATMCMLRPRLLHAAVVRPHSHTAHSPLPRLISSASTRPRGPAWVQHSSSIRLRFIPPSQPLSQTLLAVDPEGGLEWSRTTRLRSALSFTSCRRNELGC